MDFASVIHGKTYYQDLILKNTGLTPISYSEMDFDFSALSSFAIHSNSCLTGISSRRSCKITFKITNSSEDLNVQSISESVVIKNIAVNLFASLEGMADPNAVNPNLSFHPNVLDFSSVDVGSSKEISLVLRNNDSKAIPVDIGSSSNLAITVSANTCPATLPSRSACSVKLKYSPLSVEKYF